jgi:hypothetical protein
MLCKRQSNYTGGPDAPSKCSTDWSSWCKNFHKMTLIRADTWRTVSLFFRWRSSSLIRGEAMPSFLGLKYKGQAEINERRDVKRRAVGVLIRNAQRCPGAAHQGNKVPDEIIGEVVWAVMELWQKLSPEQKTILRTAKGCAVKPREVQEYQKATLADFLELGAESPESNLGNGDEVHCWGSYTMEGYEWAKQVIAANPGSFPNKGAALLDPVEAEIKKFKDARGF